MKSPLPLLETARLVGVMLHEAYIGAPLQTSETVPLNPGPAPNASAYVAVEPLLTVADVELPACGVIDSSATPVPVSATLCGLPRASSEMLTEPVC